MIAGICATVANTCATTAAISASRSRGAHMTDPTPIPLTADPVVRDQLERFGHDDDQPDMDVGHEVTDDDRLVGHDEQEHIG